MTEASASSQRHRRQQFLIKKACKIQSGSGVPNKTKVATITKAQVREIAEMKMPDLNAATVEAADEHDRWNMPFHGCSCRRLIQIL